MWPVVFLWPSFWLDFSGFQWLRLDWIGFFNSFSISATLVGRFFLMTVMISVASLIVSLVIGSLTAMGQNSRILIISYFCRAYVQIIRGTPLLSRFIFYYIIGTAWGVDNRYLAGVVILSIFEGAYFRKSFAGAWQVLTVRHMRWPSRSGWHQPRPSSWWPFQYWWRGFCRLWLVSLPRIIKDSSLLSVIAVIELTQTVQEISPIILESLYVLDIISAPVIVTIA